MEECGAWQFKRINRQTQPMLVLGIFGVQMDRERFAQMGSDADGLADED